MWYQAADDITNLTYFLMQKVLQDYLCLVNAHIYTLHRHIMCPLHHFLILQHLPSMILDRLEKTSTTIVEMSWWFYGSQHTVES